MCWEDSDLSSFLSDKNSENFIFLYQFKLFMPQDKSVGSHILNITYFGFGILALFCDFYCVVIYIINWTSNVLAPSISDEG